MRIQRHVLGVIVKNNTHVHYLYVYKGFYAADFTLYVPPLAGPHFVLLCVGLLPVSIAVCIAEETVLCYGPELSSGAYL